jgi:carboxyl-terminal processing protease
LRRTGIPGGERRRTATGGVLAALLLVCAGLGAGFSLDRPRHADLSGLTWSAAFAELCVRLQREYPFTAWKGLDWAAFAGELGPRVAAAEATRDRRAYYLALRELVWRMRDGHARLAGDDGGLKRAAIGASFGCQVVELDDGRVLVWAVTAGGPAARAGLRPGAEILTWNRQPIAAALGAVPVLWSDRPPATREGLRFTQTRLLVRAPARARVMVSFRNPESRDGASAQQAELIAEPDVSPQPGSCLGAADLLLARTLDSRVIEAGSGAMDGAGGGGTDRADAAGRGASDGDGNGGSAAGEHDPRRPRAARAAAVGYVRIRFELPTLRTPLPGHTLRRALAGFAAAGLPGVVVDVRGNCGGLDAMVPPLVAPLLREAMLYEIPGIHRAGMAGGDPFAPDPRQAVTVLPEPPLYRGRIAVLIDGDTVSAGEAVPLLLKGQPDTVVIGFHATQGSFGIGEKSVSLPAGLEVIYPHAQSLDGAGGIEVDGDAAGEGGVTPDRRLPLTAETVDRWLVRGEDLALAEAARFVRGEPRGLRPRASGGPAR